LLLLVDQTEALFVTANDSLMTPLIAIWAKMGGGHWLIKLNNHFLLHVYAGLYEKPSLAPVMRQFCY